MTSKLQFQDLIIGTGKTAERGALITAHYTGYLPDGTVFDSSHHRGQPFEAVIGTGRVIKGWDVGVLGSEYAQKIGSTPGKQDGLYWPADESKGEEGSPFGPLIASAGPYLAGHTAGDAYRGYYFRILTRQGNSAPGGAFSYLINGRMLAGFAMVAYPADYGVSGIMSFIISNNGKIYEKNLGKNGALIKEYNPTKSWKLVE